MCTDTKHHGEWGLRPGDHDFRSDVPCFLEASEVELATRALKGGRHVSVTLKDSAQGS